MTVAARIVRRGALAGWAGSSPAAISCLFVAISWLVFAAGCSDGSDSDDAAADVADTSEGTDAGSVRADGLEGSGDAGPADISESCPGGPFCSCSANDDCDSGLCIDTPDGRKCAKNCVESCPGGFACKPVASGADTVTICVPKWGKTCRPCAKEADCSALGLETARCVSYGDIGAFCGVGCDTTKDCPVGTYCAVAKTLDGASAKQCVRIKGPDTPEGAAYGLCDCSKGAVKANASTTCWLDDLTTGTPRRCKGVRQCGESGDGLSACELLDPPVCVDAQCDNANNGAPCDDGDPCTINDVCTGGQCTPGKDHCK